MALHGFAPRASGGFEASGYAPMPFVRAKTQRAAEPAYPDIAREQGAVGSTSIAVRLDAAGSVTGKRKRPFHRKIRLWIYRRHRQQRKTVYEPAIFGCRPDAGSFLFEVGFTTSNRS